MRLLSVFCVSEFMAKLLKVVNVLFVVIFGILVCQSAACYKLYENAGLVEVGMPLGALINALGEPIAMKAKASNMALWRESLLLGGVAVDVLYDEACENDQESSCPIIEVHRKFYLLWGNHDTVLFTQTIIESP